MDRPRGLNYAMPNPLHSKLPASTLILGLISGPVSFGLLACFSRLFHRDAVSISIGLGIPFLSTVFVGVAAYWRGIQNENRSRMVIYGIFAALCWLIVLGGLSIVLELEP